MKQQDNKIMVKALRLSSECIFLASVEAYYQDIIEQHKGARQRFNNFVAKHKGVN